MPKQTAPETSPDWLQPVVHEALCRGYQLAVINLRNLEREYHDPAIRLAIRNLARQLQELKP